MNFPPTLQLISSYTRERAVVTLSSESSEDDVERLVNQMAEHSRLTPSIIVRAVCVGDLSFFEHALACKSGLSVVSVRRLIHDTGALGLKAIFDKCALPSKIFRLCGRRLTLFLRQVLTGVTMTWSVTSVGFLSVS